MAAGFVRSFIDEDLIFVNLAKGPVAFCQFSEERIVNESRSSVIRGKASNFAQGVENISDTPVVEERTEFLGATFLIFTNNININFKLYSDDNHYDIILNCYNYYRDESD